MIGIITEKDVPIAMRDGLNLLPTFTALKILDNTR
jgi:hypothetical protein